ncbi:MAG: hypothetical protein IKP98_03750 [Bacilli bacterium]|nr:hypothetical protein [Bacilli bacterium]
MPIYNYKRKSRYPDKCEFGYKGYDLRDYCFRAFIEYKAIIKHVNLHFDKLFETGSTKEKQKYIDKLLERIEQYDTLSFRGSNLKLLCFKNRILYFEVIMFILGNIKDDSEINDTLIMEAIRYGISVSKKAKSIGELYYPSEQESIDFLNSISNRFLLDDLSDDKLMYKGEMLKVYCDSNNIDYKEMLNKIQYYLTYKCKMPLEKIIEECVQFFTPKVPEESKEKKVKRRKSGFTFHGEDIYTVCEEKNINYEILYKSQVRKQENLRKKGDHVSIQNLYTRFFIMYEKYENIIYKDQRLVDYLNEHNINVYSVITYIDRFKDRLTGYTMDELIDMAIYCAEHKKTILLFYNGQPIFDYCREVGINPVTFKSFIETTRTNYPKLTYKGVIEHCVRAIQPLLSEDCNYKGLSLTKLSRLTGIEYHKLFNGLIDELETEKEETEDAVKPKKDIEEVLRNIVSKYSYGALKIGDESLLDHCLDRDYDYNEVIGLINKIVETKKKAIGDGNARKGKPRIKADNDIAMDALSKYEARRKPEYLKEMINFLKTKTHRNTDQLYKVLNFLNIDQMLTADLIVRGYTPYTATMMTYYFYDTYTTDNHAKCVSDKQLEKIELLVQIFNDENYKDMISSITDLFVLVKLFKCGLVDTREQIFRLKNDLIFRCMNEYSAPEQFVKDSILEAIDKCNSNDQETMLRFIDSFVDDKCKSGIGDPIFINIGFMKKTKCKKEDK